MNEITINKEKVAEIYQNASTETKEVLKSIFGDNFMSKPKPILDDYTTIKTYEDACEALGEELLLYEPNQVMSLHGMNYEVPSHISALIKLETISRALWGKDWKPEPDAEGSKWHYYPLFALFTQSDIDDMDEDEREGLLPVLANDGTSFGCLYAPCRSSNADADLGFRLCQETEEKALYFGKQFIELWAEYLKFGFEVGERLK